MEYSELFREGIFRILGIRGRCRGWGRLVRVRRRDVRRSWMCRHQHHQHHSPRRFRDRELRFEVGWGGRLGRTTGAKVGQDGEACKYASSASRYDG